LVLLDLGCLVFQKEILVASGPSLERDFYFWEDALHGLRQPVRCANNTASMRRLSLPKTEVSFNQRLFQMRFFETPNNPNLKDVCHTHPRVLFCGGSVFGAFEFNFLIEDRRALLAWYLQGFCLGD